MTTTSSVRSQIRLPAHNKTEMTAAKKIIVITLLLVASIHAVQVCNIHTAAGVRHMQVTLSVFGWERVMFWVSGDIA